MTTIPSFALGRVRGGNWLTTAAAFAGIGRQTAKDWIRRGEQAQGLREAGLPVPESEEVYLAFVGRFRQAEAEAECRIVGRLTDLSRGTSDLWRCSTYSTVSLPTLAVFTRLGIAQVTTLGDPPVTYGAVPVTGAVGHSAGATGDHQQAREHQFGRRR